MDKKRFELRLCSNGTYYVYENGELVIDHISFDRFNKDDANDLIDLLNELYEDNRQLEVLLQEAEDEIDRLKKSNKQWMESLVNMESED